MVHQMHVQSTNACVPEPSLVQDALSAPCYRQRWGCSLDEVLARVKITDQIGNQFVPFIDRVDFKEEVWNKYKYISLTCLLGLDRLSNQPDTPSRVSNSQ